MGTPVRNGGDTHRRRGADLGAFEREGMPYLQQWRLGRAGAVPIRTFRLRFAMNAREFHGESIRQLWPHARASASPEKLAPKLSRISPRGL